MYNLSAQAKELFMSGAPMGISMQITPTAGEAVSVTNADIVQGSLTVDRYAATGLDFPVGTAAAGELSFVLDNFDGRFSGILFAGAEITLSLTVGTPGEAGYASLPCGVYTVDEAPRILSSITIVALDRMAQFDTGIGDLSVAYPCTVEDMLNALCTLAGVICDTSLSSLPNRGYVIPEPPQYEGEVTARNLLSWCCGITGTNAQMNRAGHLELLSYTVGNDPPEIDEASRFSSDIMEEITVTGIEVSAGEETVLNGAAGYVLSIKDNPLIQHDPDTVAAALAGSGLLGLVFCPFSAATLPMPWLDVMDALIFTKDDQSYPVFVTHMTQTVNANTSLRGAGESRVRKGYASLDPLTVREQQILRDIRTRTTEEINAAEQGAIDLSSMIANALGLHNLSEENADGSTTYYFGNAPSLSDSTVIYTFTASGFAWTDDWNDGNPVWQYGFTEQGNAVFNALAAYKITADYIDAGAVTADKLLITGSEYMAGGNTINDIIGEATADMQGSVDENTAARIRTENSIRIGDLSAAQDGSLYGVEIGRQEIAGSSTVFRKYARFVANRLSFYDEAENEVAYISNEKLYITNAEVTNALYLGGYRIDASQGGWAFRWIG